MKRKLIFLPAIALMAFGVLISCKNSGKKNLEKEIEVSQTVSEEEVTELTKDGFVATVGDITANPATWSYIGKMPAIVDFYATWCAPCKEQEPIIKEIAKMYKGKIMVYKIDIDKQPELAAFFNVKAVPTILFLGTDNSLNIAQGLQSKDNLIKMIEKSFPTVK